MDNVRTLDGMASDDTLYMCCKCCLTTRGRTTAETAVPNLTFAYDELRDAILLVFCEPAGLFQCLKYYRDGRKALCRVANGTFRQLYSHGHGEGVFSQR